MTLSDALYLAADTLVYWHRQAAFIVAGGLLVLLDALWVVTHR